MKTDLKIGDYVLCADDHILKSELGDRPHKIVAIREVDGPEGDAIKLKHGETEYWSKYLRKAR